MQPSDSQRRGWIIGQTLAGRTIIVVAIAGIISLIGAVLRLACVGRSCEVLEAVSADVPFCRLPDATRALVSAGFRDGRSPNILGVRRGSLEVPLPLVFSGVGFERGVAIPENVTLDRVAPTVAQAMGLERLHPEVRSGTAIEGITTGESPDLVVMVVMKGVEAPEAQEMVSFSALTEAGSATFAAAPGSSPLDPTALLTTIGTGGLPHQHGITGRLVRNDQGNLVEAWGRQSPVSVIAGLGDDLDDLTDQKAEIGLVAADPSDQGLIGGNWYISNDRDDLAVVPAPNAPAEVERLLDSGYGNSGAPDLLGVTLEGDPETIDGVLSKIVDLVTASTTSPAFVVTTIGVPEQTASMSATEIESIVESQMGTPVIEASTPGGFFVDQDVLADEGIPEDDIIAALAAVESGGTRVFADVFAAIAVSFERYC